MPARGSFLVDQIAVDGAEYTAGSLLSRSGSTSWCLGSQRGSMAGWFSGDPGGSGVVGVATCTGRGCGGALGVGSVCCAWGSGERTGLLSSFCLSDEGACVVGRLHDRPWVWQLLVR